MFMVSGHCMAALVTPRLDNGIAVSYTSKSTETTRKQHVSGRDEEFNPLYPGRIERILVIFQRGREAI